MAVVNIVPVQLAINDGTLAPVLTAMTSAADGALIPFAGGDNKMVVLVSNANIAAKTVTFKMGNGLQGVADVTVSIGASATLYFPVESGKFKNVSGTNKGKMLLVGETTDIAVGAILLP